MFLMYVDESGDPGLPGASPVFVLSGLVLHELRWKDCLESLVDFRRQLKANLGLRLREEIHAGAMLRGHHLLAHLSKPDKLAIIRLFGKRLGSIADLNVINVVVTKAGKPPGYDVFETAWKALIQRFENTITHHNFRGPANPDERGMVIADNTNGQKLQLLIRSMRKYNPVPSRLPGATLPAYRNLVLSKVIEDPSFRDSADSYFIQAVDTIAYLVYQRIQPNSYAKRKGIGAYFAALDPVLCRAAAPRDPDGIVRL